jgi:hypothetical protein
MGNGDRWTALAASSDALQVALAAWMAAATPRTMLDVDSAAREYTTGLADVIDRSVAQMYGRTLGAYRRATERLHALRATLAVVSTVSAKDTEFLRQVVADQATAGRVFKAAGAEVLAAVEKARDDERDEKGGA